MPSLASDPPRSTFWTDRNALLQVVARGCAAGLVVALLDVLGTWLLETQSLDPVQWLRWLGLTLACTAPIALLVSTAFATPVHGLLRRWMPSIANSVQRLGWRGLGAVIVLAALTVDKCMFVFRYPYMHELLALGYLALAAFVGLGRFSRKAGLSLVVATTVATLLAPLMVPASLSDDHALRRLAAHRSTLVRLATDQLPGPQTQDGDRCPWPQPARDADPHPAGTGFNVLWVSMDAVRGDLGGRQLPRIWPNITRVLPHAFRFDAAYATATRTTESLLSMLTGRWPHRLDFRPSIVDVNDQFRILASDDPRLLDPQSWKQHHPLPIADENPTLPHLLREAGYRSGAAATSVWLLPEAGVTRGFDVIDRAPYTKVRSGEIASEDFASHETTEALLRFISNTKDEQPWFAWAHYMDPHAPYRIAPGDPVPPDAPGRYIAEIQRADREIGRLLDALATRGVLDRTIVVVTSDHGEEFRDHGGLLHGTTVYDELLRVPLVVHHPGMDPATPRAIGRRISLVDMMPTLLQTLGLPLPSGLEGRSLLPLMRGQPLPERPVLGLATLHSRKAAIVTGRYKLIEEPSHELIELYDLMTDPRERTNLADREPEQVAILRCLLWGAGIFDPTFEVAG